MNDHGKYSLDAVLQIWETAVNCGDTKTRIQRASKWNSYYAYLAAKAKQAGVEEQLEQDVFFEQLLLRKALKDTDHVIDIGAGGGRYTLQFAKICEQITALDSCANNLDLIRLRAQRMGLTNIAYRNSFWETYQSEQMYDVSFCSMCPAICSMEDILRMEKMTKRMCCLITIANGSYDTHRMRMLKELKIRPDGTLTETIHYYNTLYLMGRQPSVFTHEIHQERDETEEEIMERYPVYFSIFGVSEDDAKRYLSDYLRKHAVNGVLHEKSRYRLAMISWKPEKKNP